MSNKDTHAPKVFDRIPLQKRGRSSDFMSHFSLSTFVVKEGVKSINKGLFEEFLSLKSITLPSSLLVIEENAFYRTGISDVCISKDIKRFECRVPIFIKKILETKRIECPNFYHDEEDSRREMIEQYKICKDKWEIDVYSMMIIGK